jgi:hypothetical protein
MYTFDTLTEGINNLRQRGYLLDFNLQATVLECTQLSRQFQPEEFHVDELYRFEGETDPGDSTILYGISTGMGDRGLLIEAYGAYATGIDEALIKKLTIDRNTSH